jgi:hypothetical protein
VTFNGTTYSISSTLGFTGGAGIGVTFNGATYSISSTLGFTGGTGIGVTLIGSTYSISSTLNVPSGSVLFSSDGSGISGTTGFQYSTAGVTLSKINIQSPNSSDTISIGLNAGRVQGAACIAIGRNAGSNSNPLGAGQAGNTIILNASGNYLSGEGQTGCFYVNPIRQSADPGTGYLVYDTSTKEITCEVASPTYNPSFGVSFCNANTIVDYNPGGIYATGYSYNEIPVPGVNANSIVQASSIVNGITGLYEAQSRGRYLAVECLTDRIRIWTEQPGLGSTYLGYSWNVLKF